MVINSPEMPPEWLLSCTAWWDHVTDTPDPSNTAVFSKGTPNLLKGVTPVGGHTPPNSTLGDRLAWKKAQKNLRKNKTSETMNNFIPYRRPDCTTFVWNPIKPDSDITSPHHWTITSTIKTKPPINRREDFEWNQAKKPEAILKAIKDAIKGQGDSWTKWKGWRIKFFRGANFFGWGGRTPGYKFWLVTPLAYLTNPVPNSAAGFSHQ